MFPPTQVNWTRDGEPIEEGDSYHMSQVHYGILSDHFYSL